MSFWKWDKKSRMTIEAEHARRDTHVLQTFGQRFTTMSKCAITAITLVTFYLFWIKQGIAGVFAIIILIGMIERTLKTRYTLAEYEGSHYLIIDRGRFSWQKVIKTDDIGSCTIQKGMGGLDSAVVIEYADNHTVKVRPDNEQRFIEAIEKFKGQNGRNI